MPMTWPEARRHYQLIKNIFQSKIFSAVAGDDVDGGYSRIVVQELDYT